MSKGTVPFGMTDIEDSPVPSNWYKLLRYEVTCRILQVLRRNPDVAFTSSEIQERAETNESSFYRRIDLLVDSGVVRSWSEGRQKKYQYDNESNIAEALDLIDYELQRQAERQA